MYRTRKFLITLALLPAMSTAGVWEERAYLERYVEQLEALNKTLLADAQMVSDPNARISLNYPSLIRDANEITRKLKHHLNSPLEEYRSVPVSLGDSEVFE
ncbi:RAQPRD family integrative conjugative element protein [Enterovibrio norvegicus]|uniref:RAQPRD family integrative conjugative element protein n=1 Tax=Enterovibrio norvegicus TaxID=188144 RepID=UPI000C8567EE|nr:RAQPRD family integrative conjugative element protein [Enterovibrio norvegicus]PMH64435.1 hypothetical protein BCU62_15385 [Enterovibrio norvegicus]